jgi:ADP-ribosylglycohydrolase
MADKERALIGCLLGTAVGDSLGLPYEGMSGSRGGRMFPDWDRFHFLPGFGMVSDDTEHACFTAQAIIRSKGDPERFEKELARSLRWWLLGLPAGIGFATLRSIMRLWTGVPPAKSGVFSAGNGPAMRSPLLGAAFGDDPDRLKDRVLRSTRMTHRDPKAYAGALAVAVAAHLSASGRETGPGDFLDAVTPYLAGGPADELPELLAGACASAEKQEPVGSFAGSLGSKRGISGYMYHTVPCVIQVWLRYQRDYRGGIREIITAGGDTDTTAAILGGLIGAGVGREGIPAGLLSRIIEWPRSIGWMERLAAAAGRTLEGEANTDVPGYLVPGIAARNTAFTAIMLLHGLRRLLPPY